MKQFRRGLTAPAGALFLGWATLACSASPVSGGGTGGAVASGGATASGGSAPQTGGATGGAPLATGGTTPSTGGVPTTGGAAGAATTGGSTTGGTATGGGAGAATGGSTAGVAGMSAGGAAGASNGGGNGGAPTTDAFLREDFESGTNGQQPTGWDNFISYQKNIKNPADDGTLAVVDSTRARSGTKSLKVHGGSNPAMLTRPLPSGTNKLYVRAHFYMTRQLGMNPGANHETLLGIRKDSGSANNEVRFGEIKGVIGTNEVPTDNISPKMDRWGMGPVVAANQWACIEVAFIADKTPHELSAWVNDELVHSITAVNQWQNGDMMPEWMSGKFVEFIIGWQSFSNATNDLWIDDLVLSTSRINCN